MIPIRQEIPAIKLHCNKKPYSDGYPAVAKTYITILKQIEKEHNLPKPSPPNPHVLTF